MITKEQCDNAGIEYLDESDLEQMYDDMLNEVYGTINICGYNYCASDTLRTVDPTAYRCGFGDYVDSLTRDGDYIEIEDECLITKEDARTLENE